MQSGRVGKYKYGRYIKVRDYDTLFNTNIKYYFNHTQKNCVVCNSNKNMQVHHVVPHFLRVYFPLITDGLLRKQDRHDLLPVCSKCHHEYEPESTKFFNLIAEEYGFNNHETMAIIFDRIRGVFYNIKRGPNKKDHKGEHPIIFYLEHQARIEKKYEHYFIGAITKEVHDFMLHVNFSSDVAYFIMQQNRYVVDLQKFVERWRQHFIDYCKPQYLPDGWNINRSILLEASCLTQRKNNINYKYKNLKNNILTTDKGLNCG